MFTSILTYLVQVIKYQKQIIFVLLQFISSIYAHSKVPKTTKLENLNYQKLIVDELPVIRELEQLDHRQLLQEHLERTGKVLAPIRRRKDSSAVSPAIHCPKCQAPADYLYKNNGDQGQYLCKVCSERFNEKNKYSKDVILTCPHCDKTLDKIKERKGFDVHKCRNEACPYYLHRLKSLSPKEWRLFEKEPSAFKMHYIYRRFALTIEELAKPGIIDTTVSLNRIHSSPRVLGLILTYHVNYGLTASKTAALMYDVHQVKISGQTIRNYAKSAAAVVQPFVDYYPYELSDQFCGDETYIRVLGKWNYLYFFFDAVNKIILSHRVSLHRDTETAIKAIYDVLRRFEEIPEDLNLITDGNPIYLLARQFFAQNGIHFDITQVIGLTNEDEVSKEFRPLKQIIERLNRTFKGSYKPTGGFGSSNGSIAFVTLFCAYFNFLRPHSSLEKGQIPVQLPELLKCPDMPAKWLELIRLSNEYLKQIATSPSALSAPGVPEK